MGNEGRKKHYDVFIFIIHYPLSIFHCLLAFIIAMGGASWAQDSHAVMQMEMPGHAGMTMHPLGLPLSRDGAGTSWLPDSTPMYGIMQRAGGWNLMHHGAAYLAYDRMNGPRGDDKLFLPNWYMLMARRNTGPQNYWRLSAMISLDPLTVGGGGYPLLFQTGETWKDKPLKDHQHPHNLFSELSGMYTHAISADSALFLYAAAVGQPALGPVTYMHRTFALDNPLAPIGHHWQDATHIAYGVATAGYQTRLWQAEVSTFNGREPGENRFEIQSPTFDSASGRISLNLTNDLALQASYGYLHSPESLHPEQDAHRLTASAIYNYALGIEQNFQTSLVWGRNIISNRNLDSLLLETQWKHDGGWTPYARYEIILKDAEELVLPQRFTEDEIFTLRQATIGIVRDLPWPGSLQWGIGGQAVFSFVPDKLKPVYGNNPTGWLIFIRLYPKRMEPDSYK